MKKRIYILFLIINMLLIIILLLFPLKRTSKLESYDSQALTPATIIEPDKKYSQDVVCLPDELSIIGFKLSTYAVNNKDGKIKIDFYNNNTKKTYSKEIELSTVYDNQIYLIKNDVVMCKKDEVLNVSFYYSDYKEGNSLTYWYKSPEKYNLFIDDKKVDQQIVFEQYGKSEDRTFIWYPLLLIVMGSVVYCIGKDEKDEK